MIEIILHIRRRLGQVRHPAGRDELIHAGRDKRDPCAERLAGNRRRAVVPLRVYTERDALTAREELLVRTERVGDLRRLALRMPVGMPAILVDLDYYDDRRPVVVADPRRICTPIYARELRSVTRRGS